MELRPYQHEAVQAVYQHLRSRDDNPCVVIPTAGGKTPVMATICRDAVMQWNGRVLILAHVKELLEQAVEKLHTMAPDLWMQIGVYSAGLRQRDTDHSIIVAGIQSIYKRAAELDRFDLILVDECFVSGTMVSTPSGQIPIEQIQPGMTVHNASGVGRVVAISARPAQDLVTLEYSDGTTVTCTVNHPIFTERGWRRAGKLELGSLAFGIEDMRMLRGRIPAVVEATAHRPRKSAEGTSLAEAEILFSQMREAAGKLHAIQGSQEKGQRYVAGERALPNVQRWQRGADAASEATSSGLGSRLGVGIGCDGSQPPLRGYFRDI